MHPGIQAIKRHLRGEGHRCTGETLRQAISTLTSLPVRSLQDLLSAPPAIDTQPITPPVPHLKVFNGWSCLPCRGHFLTTSLEIVQRHVATQHGRRRGDQLLWEACELQTLFSETKDRHYFRLTGRKKRFTSSAWTLQNFILPATRESPKPSKID